MAGTTTYYGVTYPTSTDYVKDGATAIQTVATGFDSAVAIPTYNAQTGATYTFALTDVGKTVTASNAGASTYTIPPTASVAWPTGTTLEVTNLGAGVVTFAAGAGVTVTNTAQTLAQYQSANLIRTGLNAWTVTPTSGGSSGLTLINATTFSAQSSVSISDVFSATYENYVAIMSFVSSANAAISFRYRVSGADNTTSNYAYHTQNLSNASTAYAASVASTATALALTSSDGTASVKAASMNIFRPFATDYTSIMGFHNFSTTSGTQPYLGGLLQSGFTATTSFTGFTVFPGSGTITGTIRVYGVQNG